VPAESLIEWPQPILELIGFIAAFFAAGGVGFRYAALRPLRRSAAPGERSLADGMATRAAMLGLVGTLTRVTLFAIGLPGNAARRHVTPAVFITGNPTIALQLGLWLLTIAGFALAPRRGSIGWTLAALGVIAGALTPGFFGQWARMVNPLHVLAGGLWIGTLFMLLTLGIPAALRGGSDGARRGARVAEMVNGFSPLALGSAGALAVFGVITAWRHLHTLAALWTTPYGDALIAKLCVVMGVAGLGAWNWRRAKPRLGSESAAHELKRSARLELMVAAVVLLITAILVSLPSPRPPGG